jgi:hypothetical protein
MVWECPSVLRSKQFEKKKKKKKVGQRSKLQEQVTTIAQTRKMYEFGSRLWQKLGQLIAHR